MTKLRIIILAVLLMVFFQTASAHVALLYPVGGETFQAGEIIAIQWQVVINHGPANWDLYFSEDGGSTWQPIVTDLANSVLEYNWTVPAEATNSGQVKVTQDNDTGVDYSDSCNNFTVNVSTGIKKSHNLPDKFVLHPAYPNPFNPTTTIRYELFKSARVSLKIYNMVGEEVITLVNGIQSPGEKSIVWDAKNNLGQIVASGIYFYQLQANGEVRTKKLIFMK
jgi:hypothetical protein